MSTYKATRDKATRTHFATSLLVLLYLITIILPARATSVGAEATNCPDNLQAASVADQVVPAANQEVIVPKETVDKAVVVSYWNMNSNLYDVPNIVLDSFLLYSNLEPGSDLLHQFRDRYTEQLNTRNNVSWAMGKIGYDDIVHTMFNVALDMPELAPHVPNVWKKLSEEENGWLFDDPKNQVASSAQRYSMNDTAIKLGERTLIKMYDCAQANPAVAQAFDELHKEKFNIGIRDSAKTVIEKNPTLPILTDIRDRLGEDGTITVSLNELKEMTQTEFGKLNDTLDQMQDTLQEIDDQQDVIIDYLKDQELKAKWQEVAKKKAEEYQLQLNAIQSSLSLITTIVGQFNPRSAKEIAVVGNASLQIGTALNGWIKATAGLDGLDKLTSLSTVVMTGNVLGAVVNIISLFGDSQPTPEEMILEEIGKLRQQVNELRVEMHDRFDRIDEGLNAIHTTMNERFNQIDIQLGKINGNILEVQQSLMALDLKLSRIERNNFEFLNALGRRPLLEAINGGLGYQARTGVPMPYQPEFVAFENQLHSWGTIHAFDPVNAGPTQRDYSDAALLTELNAYPLDANLNYINGWLVAHGFPAIANKPLPSPRDWLFASRAYTQLGLEWPEHLNRIDPQRQVALHEIGVDLENAMQKLSTLVTANGPQGNSLLFSTVITQYENKLTALDNSLQGLEMAFVNEVRTNRLDRAEPFSLHGGVHQVVAYRSAELTNATCGNPQAKYPLSADFIRRVPNANLYNLAEYLKLGNFYACISDQWLSTTGLPHHKAILSLFFEGLPIMSQTIDDGQMPMPATGADTFTRDNWTNPAYNYSGKFAALNLVDQPSPELAAQRDAFLKMIMTRVETALSGYQQEFYGRALREMTNGTIKPLAVELAGSKQLLDGLVTLGLPRAVGSDEFVHAMLYGNQQLVDDSQLAQSYAISSTKPITGANLLVNPRLVLSQAGNQRIDVFAGLIDEYLAGITAQTHVEAPDYIVNTRRALDLTVRIMKIAPATSNQTISFNPLGDQLLGNPPFSVSATASSGLSISFVSFTQAVCTVDGNTVTLMNITGTCTLQATQPGNANFKPAPSVVQSFAVKSTQKAEQSITFAKPANQQVGAAPFPLSASASSGLTVSLTSNTVGVCMVNGDIVTLSASGICAITATQEGNDTINPATPVVQSFTVSSIGGSGGAQTLYLPFVNR